jgi:hypothetical protein
MAVFGLYSPNLDSLAIIYGLGANLEALYLGVDTQFESSAFKL